MNHQSIVFLLSHSSAGGVQEIWANLAEGFRIRGFDVRLMALYPYRAQVRETSPDLPWQYVISRRPTAIGAQIKMLMSLVSLLRKNAPDMIFTAMPAANVLAPIAARLAGASTRIVISHHSPVSTHSRILNKIDGWVGSWPNVQTVVTVSDAVGESLHGKPNAYVAKRRTIHNALPPDIEALLTTLSAERERKATHGRRVVATGRLFPQKNYPVLVRAAAHMPDVKVVIVGTGPEEAMLKALAAELGVTDRIDFVGHRSRKEALGLLSEGDIFVQPSWFEGHSLGLIEAAKLQLPLVVSNVPVQIEGITAADGTACGIAVDPSDDKALAREILRLLDDPAHYLTWTDRARHLANAITYEGMILKYEELVHDDSTQGSETG
jgi:glycosyltransferase involved in cell wall biosynthesis